MLELVCSKCLGYLITYQKDGPGPLLRCYTDRIRKGSDLEKDELLCSSCKAVVGKKGIYKKENRPAFYLEQDSFYVKILY